MCFDYDRDLVRSKTNIDDVYEHLAYNTGNMLFLDAINGQIQADATFTNFEDIVDGAKTVVLSMGNWLSPDANLEWHADCLERSQVERCVVVGLGAQSQSHSGEIKLLPGTRRFLDLVAERSTTLGVRGDYTAEVLNGFGVKNVDVIGCPSVFASKYPFRQLDVGRVPRLSVNATFHGHYRDGVAEILNYGLKHDAQYLEQSDLQLMKYIDSGRLNYWANFISHYYAFSHDQAFDILSWLSMHGRYYTSVGEWVEDMQSIDLAIGSRFHGCLAANYGGARSLLLIMDTRTKELAEYYNIPHMKFEDFDGEQAVEFYYEKADPQLFLDTLPNRLARYAKFLERNGLKLTEAFQSAVLEQPVSNEEVGFDLIAQDAVSIASQRFSADAKRLELDDERVRAELEMRSMPLRTLEEGAETEVANPLLSYSERHNPALAAKRLPWIGRQRVADGYEPQPDPVAYDDTDKRDEWQNSVYLNAVQIAKLNGLESVVDFGCGSAFKLLKYFKDFRRTGVDIGATLDFLKTTYPEERWVDGTIIHPMLFDADMVICSDVIEHLMEPDLLLSALAKSRAKVFVLSTPALEILSDRGESRRLGPPVNRGHVVEWTTWEFAKLVNEHLHIKAHFVSHLTQATQTCIAVKNKSETVKLGELIVGF